MTNKEKVALHQISHRLRELSTLNNASFVNSTEQDDYIKQEIKPYMSWYILCADYIDDILRVTDEADRHKKDAILSDIIRYCN